MADSQPTSPRSERSSESDDPGPGSPGDSSLNDLGRKILRLFVKDETAGAPAPPVQSVAGKPVAAQRTNPSPSESAPASMPVEPDAKFAAHLASVLEKANLPGPDYFEFREILKNLAQLGLSEEKQFGAAWASFRAMAGNASNGAAVLTGSARQYLTTLQADREAFLKSAEAAVTEKIGSLQGEKTRLQAENEALTKQLQELQNRLKANAERLQAIGGEIDGQNVRIQQNRQAYEATFAAFSEQIKADVARIERYLLNQSSTN